MRPFAARSDVGAVYQLPVAPPPEDDPPPEESDDPELPELPLSLLETLWVSIAMATTAVLEYWQLGQYLRTSFSPSDE